MEINQIFENTISWVKENYDRFGFIMERDFVWTVQKELTKRIKQEGLPYLVFNDYPIEKGEKRSTSVDIAVVQKSLLHHDILTGKAALELAVELKFEPSSDREEIQKHKLPVTSWSEILKDIDRITRFVKDGKTKYAYAYLIDENSLYRSRLINEKSHWETWGTFGTEGLNVSVLKTFLSCGL